MNYEQIIDKLAAKLSVPAAHLWEILVRQARIEAALSAFWIIFGVVAVITFLRIRVRMVAWAEEKDENGYAVRDDEFVMAGYWVCGGIATAVCLIVALSNVGPLVSYLFNPDYYALQQIIGALK